MNTQTSVRDRLFVPVILVHLRSADISLSRHSICSFYLQICHGSTVAACRTPRIKVEGFEQEISRGTRFDRIRQVPMWEEFSFPVSSCAVANALVLGGVWITLAKNTLLVWLV
eukprot:1181567-Prorocentrum_minimum.AAC.5